MAMNALQNMGAGNINPVIQNQLQPMYQSNMMGQPNQMGQQNQFGQVNPMQQQKPQGFWQNLWRGLNKFGKGVEEFSIGKSGGFDQLNIQTPQGMQALNLLLSQGMQNIQDPSQGFEPIAQESRRMFEQETLPSIAQRFGAWDSKRGSGYQNALTQAGSNLESQLAALRSQYGLGQQQNALQQLQLGLQPQFENYYRLGTEGIVQPLLRTAANIGGTILTDKVGNYFDKTEGQNYNINDIRKVLSTNPEQRQQLIALLGGR